MATLKAITEKKITKAFSWFKKLQYLQIIANIVYSALPVLLDIVQCWIMEVP